MQIAFGKAQPAVSIQIVSLVEMMLQKVGRSGDLAATPKDFMGAADGPFRIIGMVQGLAEHNQINAFRIDGRLFQVSSRNSRFFKPFFSPSWR